MWTTNLPGLIPVPEAGIPTSAYKFGCGVCPGAFVLVPCCRTESQLEQWSGVEKKTSLPIGWGVPSLVLASLPSVALFIGITFVSIVWSLTNVCCFINRKQDLRTHSSRISQEVVHLFRDIPSSR